MGPGAMTNAACTSGRLWSSPAWVRSAAISGESRVFFLSAGVIGVFPRARMSSLIQRIRIHLIDERIHDRVEANAEIELMTQVELVEVISFVLDDLLAGRPTYAPGEFAGDRRRARRAGNTARSGGPG